MDYSLGLSMTYRRSPRSSMLSCDPQTARRRIQQTRCEADHPVRARTTLCSEPPPAHDTPRRSDAARSRAFAGTRPPAPGLGGPVATEPKVRFRLETGPSGEVRRTGIGRVEVWRGDCRSNTSVAAPFVWRCLTGSALAPSPHPAHRTGHADLPHPALGQDITPSPTPRRAQAGSDARARSARRGARVDKPRPCVA